MALNGKTGQKLVKCMQTFPVNETAAVFLLVKQNIVWNDQKNVGQAFCLDFKGLKYTPVHSNAYNTVCNLNMMHNLQQQYFPVDDSDKACNKTTVTKIKQLNQILLMIIDQDANYISKIY